MFENACRLAESSAGLAVVAESSAGLAVVALIPNGRHTTHTHHAHTHMPHQGSNSVYNKLRPN
eukprot:15474454-Alexandrium_andersonii.AAC.1